MSAVLLLVFLALLLASGFCSGLETGFLSVPKIRVEILARQGSLRAKRLAKALANLPRVVTTLLVANNIVNVAASTVATVLVVSIAPGSAAVQTLLSVWMAVLILFCGEYLPKLLFASRPMRRMLSVIAVYRIVEMLLRPVAMVFDAFVRLLFGVQKTVSSRSGDSRDRLRRLVADTNDATKLTPFERRLIDRVLMLQTMSAGKMAKRCPEGAEMPTLRIPANMRGDDILPMMRRAREAEAQVYDVRTGAVVGVVTEEDVLYALTGVLKNEP
jgi:CBS domain containing-hemolysin-like protein